MTDDNTDKTEPGVHYQDGLPIIETRLEAVEHRATEAEKRDRRYKDRQLWTNVWVMLFTGLLFLTSAVSSGISIWQARIANVSANAASDSVQIARRQLELLDRPWIKLTGVVPNGTVSAHTPTGIAKITPLDFMTFEFGGRVFPPFVSFNFEMTLKVEGHSPALNVQQTSELYLAKWRNEYSSDVTKEEKRFCDNWLKNEEAGAPSYTATFPDESKVVDMGVEGNLSPQTTNDFSGTSTAPLVANPKARYILPVLIGCVTYHFQSSDSVHQDRFVYEIFHRNPPRTRFFMVCQGVSREGLWLIRNDADDYYD